MFKPLPIDLNKVQSEKSLSFYNQAKEVINAINNGEGLIESYSVLKIGITVTIVTKFVIDTTTPIWQVVDYSNGDRVVSFNPRLN